MNLSKIFMDRLGPDIFSTFYMKGEVLHRVRAFKVPGLPFVWSAIPSKKLHMFFISLN